MREHGRVRERRMKWTFRIEEIFQTQSLEKEGAMWDNWGVTSVKKEGKSVKGNARGN